MEINTLIRILVIDDHEAIRTHVVSFLQFHKDIEVVGWGKNSEEAILMCECFYPDVILMDLSMPLMDGVSAIRTIHERYPAVQIIAFSHNNEPLIEDALRAGASCHISKTVHLHQMLNEIRECIIRSSHQPHLSTVDLPAPVSVTYGVAQ